MNSVQILLKQPAIDEPFGRHIDVAGMICILSIAGLINALIWDVQIGHDIGHND